MSPLPKANQTVGDKFRIISELGRGTMGVVYAARDRQLHRDVAIKFMLPALATDKKLCDRFLREAQAVAQLRGHFVTRIHEVGMHQDEIPFIVMERLYGHSVEELLARQGRLSLVESMDYVMQASVALAEAHAHDIVHRDLKPANLFIDHGWYGRAQLKVLDFGIAKLSAYSRYRLTIGPQALGTPLYMAPEQWSEAATVDHRADIWSLGVVLYELLVGKVPFGGESSSSLARSIQEDRPLAADVLRPEIPREVSEAILACLEKDPTRRFPNIEAFARRIMPFASATAAALLTEIANLTTLPPGSIRRYNDSEIPKAPQPAPEQEVVQPDAKIVFDSHREPSYPFHSQNLLLKLLGYRFKQNRSVVFLVGSALTAPREGSCGVPTAHGIINLIRARYLGEDLDDFDAEILQHRGEAYQRAFEYLLATQGADAVGEVIREAVLCAYLKPPPEAVLKGDHDACVLLEREVDSWVRTPGLDALTGLIADYGGVFGHSILTSNFDPLIEVALRSRGAHFIRTVLQSDGELHSHDGDGCHIVHFHGDWFRSDTLHTPSALWQRRPKLSGALARMLRERALVVVGYGGWNDVFTRCLVDAVRTGGDAIDVSWAFHDEDETQLRTKHERLLAGLGEAIGRGRVRLYKGVNIHTLLPELYDRITSNQPFSLPFSRPPMPDKPDPEQPGGSEPPLPKEIGADLSDTMASDLQGVKESSTVSSSSTNLKKTAPSMGAASDEDAATIPRISRG